MLEHYATLECTAWDMAAVKQPPNSTTYGLTTQWHLSWQLWFPPVSKSTVCAQRSRGYTKGLLFINSDSFYRGRVKPFVALHSKFTQPAQAQHLSTPSSEQPSWCLPTPCPVFTSSNTYSSGWAWLDLRIAVGSCMCHVGNVQSLIWFSLPVKKTKRLFHYWLYSPPPSFHRLKSTSFSDLE